MRQNSVEVDIAAWKYVYSWAFETHAMLSVGHMKATEKKSIISES